MKNLMIFIHPRGFNEEHKRLIDIQIDNSLKFWKNEDILIVMNFPYEYNGIKAMVVDTKLVCRFHPKISKINVIIYLLENKLIDDDLIWFHDFDAFQISSLDDIKLEKEIGVTEYHINPSIFSTGSIFFRQSALDIFKWIKEESYGYKINQEKAFKNLVDKNFNNIASRYQILNRTYNLTVYDLEYSISIADKPIKVVHFHPKYTTCFKVMLPILPDYLTKMLYEKSFTTHKTR